MSAHEDLIGLNQNQQSLESSSASEGESDHTTDDEIIYSDSSSEGDFSEHDEEDEELDQHLRINEQEPYFYVGRDRITKWSSSIPSELPKTKTLPNHTPSVKPYACIAKTEIDCWRLFFSNDILDEILLNTNAKIKSKQHGNVSELNRETTLDELLAFFGLIYLASIHLTSWDDIDMLFTYALTRIDIFPSTMPLERFCFLRNCLRFDSTLKRNIAAIKPIFNEFNANCSNAYNPGQHLIINEKLQAIRDNIGCFRWRPQRPNIHVLKIFSLMDERNFYSVNLEIDTTKHQKEAFLSGDDVAFDTIERLIKPISKSRRHVTLNEWFGHAKFVKHLLINHNITSTAELRTNQAEVPLKFIKPRREAKSAIFGFHDDLALLSYAPNKNKIKLMLSSLYKDGKRSTLRHREAPEILNSYDYSQFRLDTFHEFTAIYDVSQKSKKYSTRVFYVMLNVAASNARVIYRLNNNNAEVSTSTFITSLGKALIEPYNRAKSDDSSDSSYIDSDEEMENEHSRGSQKRTGCEMCQACDTKRFKYSCEVCNKAICHEHVGNMCDNCSASSSKNEK